MGRRSRAHQPRTGSRRGAIQLPHDDVLALAAKARWPVADYQDHAVAHLGKNAKGQLSVTRVDLHPVVRFDKGFSVDAAELEKMQARAHRYCFIANTLADSIEIKIL